LSTAQRPRASAQPPAVGRTPGNQPHGGRTTRSGSRGAHAGAQQQCRQGGPGQWPPPWLHPAGAGASSPLAPRRAAACSTRQRRRATGHQAAAGKGHRATLPAAPECSKAGRQALACPPPPPLPAGCQGSERVLTGGGVRRSAAATYSRAYCHPFRASPAGYGCVGCCSMRNGADSTRMTMCWRSLPNAATSLAGIVSEEFQGTSSLAAGCRVPAAAQLGT
jgi:hypothetical protein